MVHWHRNYLYCDITEGEFYMHWDRNNTINRNNSNLTHFPILIPTVLVICVRFLIGHFLLYTFDRFCIGQFLLYLVIWVIDIVVICNKKEMLNDSRSDICKKLNKSNIK